MSDNIKVAIRVRPLIARERNKKLEVQWEIKDNSIYPIDPKTGKMWGENYYFDHIFGSTCCNKDIYNTVIHPVVEAAINGFNGTIFAYGQTSSGKTYTMMGNLAEPGSEPGVISMAVDDIFRTIEHSVNKKFLLRVSYMEIYNEKVNDLLDMKDNLKVHEDIHGAIMVDVKEAVTDSAEDVYRHMKIGNKAKKTEETNMNEKSSRSHTIFRIIIESSDINDSDVVNVAHLNLVDLAGSERATLTKATGMRFKEGAHINKSLSTLSHVMKQLSDSQNQYVNFRDSKLTRILQSSLGGNALTTIICAITPVALEETHSTLAFASRAKTIKNKPHLNKIISDEALLNRYARQIDDLKRELEKAKNSKEEMSVKLEKKISLLEKCILFSPAPNVKQKVNSKNRRNTWSTFLSPNKALPLPVIYESDTLNVEADESDEKIDSTLNIEEMWNGMVNSSSAKRMWHSERKTTRFFRMSRPDSESGNSTPETVIENDIEEKNLSPCDKGSDDVVKWLANDASDTPKSILRERAAYYEQEFNLLRELTTKEKELLYNEQLTQIESLNLELSQAKCDLVCEKSIRIGKEKMFETEKLEWQNKFDDLKKKNTDLSQTVRQLQAQRDKYNDSEYLVDLYKEKYRKREKELLECLKEAREALLSKNTYNNIGNEDNLAITSSMALSDDMHTYINSLKSKLDVLKVDLDAEKPVSNILNLLNDLWNENEINEMWDHSEEFQELLTALKYSVDTSKMLLTDDTLLSQLEREKTYLWKRVTYLQSNEKTYDTLVKKQDEEIKHLSENILEYMHQLKIYKDELNFYKNVVKKDTNTQADIEMTANKSDMSVKSNIEELHSTQVLLEETTFDHGAQTEDSYKLLLKDKDREIEELSDKIMDYLDQLTETENELMKYKSIIRSDAFIQTDISNEMEDKRIQELTEKMTAYVNELTVLEQKLEKYKTALELEQNNLKVKEKNIKELSENLDSYKNKFYASQKELEKYKNSSFDADDLINLKNKEIEEIIAKLEYYMAQTDENENELRECKKDLLIKQDLINTKNEEIKTISENLLLITVKLQMCEKELETMKLDTVNDKNLIRIQNEKNSQLSESLSLCRNQLSLHEEELNKHREEANIRIKCMCNQEDEYKDMLLKYESQVNELEQEFKKREMRYENEIKSLINKQEDKCKDLAGKVVEYEGQVNELKEVLKKREMRYENEIKSLISKQEDKCKDHIGKVVEYEGKVNELDQELKKREMRYENEISEQEDKCKDLEGKVVVYEGQVNELEQKLKKYEIRYENEIQCLKIKNNTAMNAHSHQLAETEKKLRVLRNIKEKFFPENTTNSEENWCTALEENICTLYNKLTEAENKLSNYESNLEANQDILNLKSKKVEELSAEILLFSNQIAAKEEELNQARENLNIAQNIIQRREDAIFQMCEVFAELNSDLHQNNDAKIELSNCKEFVENADEKIEMLCEKIRIFLQQLKAKEAELIKFDVELINRQSIMDETYEDLNIISDQLSSASATLKQVTLFDEFENNIASINLRDGLSIRNKDMINLSEKINCNVNQLVAVQKELLKSKCISKSDSSTQTIDTLHCVNKMPQFGSPTAEKQVELIRLKLENKTLSSRLKSEESKSQQYLQSVESLKNELKSNREKITSVINELELTRKTSTELSSENETLKKEICSLKEQVNSSDTTLKQYKCYFNSLETEKNNTKVDVRSLDNEKENSNINLVKEIDNLKAKNLEYKRIKEQTIQKTNEKIANFRSIIYKLKTENEVLNSRLQTDNSSRQTLSLQIADLKSELEKKKEGTDTVQNQLQSFESQNKKLQQIIDQLQVEFHKKSSDLKSITKYMESLKVQNTDLIKTNNYLKEELLKTKEQLNHDSNFVELVEKERENYKDQIRVLEESLEDAKFQLHELKNKERIRNKKAKRQSLHDSSRSLSGNESCLTDSTLHQNAMSEKLPNEFNASEEAAKHADGCLSLSPLKEDCERCKYRATLPDKHIQEQDRELSKLRLENESLRKKNEMLKGLCKLRKAKLDDFEKQTMSSHA